MVMHIAAIGDVCLGEHYFNFGDGVRSSIERGVDPFGAIRSSSEKVDLLLANFEGTVCNSKLSNTSPKDRVFDSSMENLEVFRSFPLTVVNVANNHTLEQGAEGFRDTCDRLEERGIFICGRSESNGVVRIRLKEKLVSCIGVSLVEDVKYEPGTYFYPEHQELISVIRNEDLISDYVIVSIHWGDENCMHQLPEQEDLASKMCLAGANVICGHHPHLFYSVDKYLNSVICYSLGDFVFDLVWNRSIRKSGIVFLTVKDDATIDVKYQATNKSRDGIPKQYGEKKKIEEFPYKPHENIVPRIALLESKYLYFFLNLLRGDVRCKLNFILKKIKLKCKIFR